MSDQHLPAQISPFKLARQGQVLQGVIQVKGMERLVQVLSRDDAGIAVTLHFDKDPQGVSFARGHLSAKVEMICQRCMKPMTVPVEADVSLGFVTTDEQAGKLSDRYEPCMVTDEPVSLAGIVEDEIMLALPIVALHPEQSCEPVMEKLHREAREIGQPVEKPNPFAVLSQLKRQE
jgi:uncharacterized protein